MAETRLERGAWGAALACLAWLVLMFSPVARASEPSGNLYKLVTRGWRRSCPSSAWLRSEIVRQLGWDPFRENADKMVSVTLAADDNGLGGVVELVGPSGELLGRREIASSRRRCLELSKALALVVTLALDERARSSGAPVEAPGAPSSPVATIASEAYRPPTKPPSGLRWSMGLGGVLALGSGPGWGIGGLIAGEARWPRWSIGLEGVGSGLTGAAVSGGSVSASIWSATAAGCARRLLGLELLGACGLVTVGDEQARGTGYPGEHSADGLFLAAGGRALATLVAVDPFSLLAQVDVLVPLRLAHFTIGGNDLWQAPLIEGSAGLRASFAF
jgi:hypothetical protein